MRINRIYRALCEINGADAAHDVERFVVMSCGRAADHVVGNQEPGREALLIQQAGDEIRLGIYLAPEIIAALESADPMERLDEFSCAVEGVSHFIYVADRADRERQVTRLELELQAEVDKFTLIHLLASESSGGTPYGLFERQFEGYRLDERLDAEEAARYVLSSRLAAGLCSRLRAECFNPLRLGELMDRASVFFRLNLGEKLRLLKA